MKRLRHLRFGLSTVAGLARRGFFIPYRYAETVAERDYPALEPLFQAAEPGMRQLLLAIDSHADAFTEIGPPARFDQAWFPRLDACAAYALVREHRPRRIVEIGSGHSTRFMAKAVADGGLGTRILCIDPAPRATLAALGVEHRARVFTDVDVADMATLAPGDMLFIDSSHVAMPGTDVDRLVLDVLPRLAPGVLVHVHDILLPDRYPAAWTWRGYNEQTVVGALLVGGGWEIVFASHYAATRLQQAVAQTVLAQLPLRTGVSETSLWLRRG